MNLETIYNTMTKREREQAEQIVKNCKCSTDSEKAFEYALNQLCLTVAQRTYIDQSYTSWAINNM